MYINTFLDIINYIKSQADNFKDNSYGRELYALGKIIKQSDARLALNCGRDITMRLVLNCGLDITMQIH